MKVMVVFESMYGNTRPIAEAVGSGFDERDDVRVEAVADVDPTSLRADLLVVGGRTQVHGLTTPTTWRTAFVAAGQDPSLMLGPTPCGESLHEWLNALPQAQGRGAAFDTRLDAPVPPTGHASSTIAKRLKRRGYQLIAEPHSFLIDHESTLIDGELERARRWGEALSAEMHSPDGNIADLVSSLKAADRNAVPARVPVPADN